MTTNPYIITSIKNFPSEVRNNLNNYNNDSNQHDSFSFTGIYEPLNIIYFVNNNKIFLWSYSEKDFIIFDKIQSTILNLYFTVPKKDVFADEIRHIAIASTESYVYIILINVDSDNNIKLILSDYYVSISCNVNSIVSTGNKRIFIGCDNNNLFELNYTVILHLTNNNRLMHHSLAFSITKYQLPLRQSKISSIRSYLTS